MRRIRIISLLLVMAWMLASCGGGSGSGTAGGQEGSGSQTQQPDAVSAQNKQPDDSPTEEFLRTITAETAEAKGMCGADLVWYYKDNVLLIRGTGEMLENTGTSSISWYDYKDDIIKVVIDEGCTKLNEGTFMYYDSLSSVILPDSLTELDDNVFFSCENLQKVVLPSGLKAIGANTFCGCYKLKELDLPDGLVEIGNGAFYFCSGLESIRIPDSVTKIGEDAFGHCDSITELTIPAGVAELGYNSLARCDNLVKVDLRNPDYILEDGVIFNADKTAIVSVVDRLVSGDTYVIPDSVSELPPGAFSSNTPVRNLVFPESFREFNRIGYFTTVIVEPYQFTYTFLGSAPNGMEEALREIAGYTGDNTYTIRYSDSSFEQYVERYPDVIWIKQ